MNTILSEQEIWSGVVDFLAEIGVDANSDDFSWYIDACDVIAKYTHNKLSVRDMMVAQDKLSDLLLDGIHGISDTPIGNGSDRIQGQIRAMALIPELKDKGLTYAEKEALAFCVYYSRCVRVFDEVQHKIVPTFSEFRSFENIDIQYKDSKKSHPNWYEHFQGLVKSIEYFDEEKYRNLDYGTIYYVAGTDSSDINNYVLSQLDDIAERLNIDERNWVTSKIVYLPANNSLFPKRKNASFYSALMPSDDIFNSEYKFLVAVLFDCTPELMFDAFSKYFDTVQQMLNEILDEGDFDERHLNQENLIPKDKGILFSITQHDSDEVKYDDGIRFSITTEERGEESPNDNIRFSVSTKPDANQNVFQDLPLFSQPSRLIIMPGSYRILLPDYSREIHFTAQVKALYVLFLNHPGGIRMKEITDYKAEYAKLYLRFTNRSDTEQIRDAVERLFDVFSPNALNVKKSQCAEQLKKAIPENHLRQYYEIEVKRGQPHTINLDRSLVSMPDDLRM